MANSLTALNPEYWSRRMQILLKKSLVAMAVTNMEERAVLVNGDKVHRPYTEYGTAEDYTKGTDVTIQDITATDESLDVDQAKIIPLYVDDLDQIQNKYNTQNDMIKNSVQRLREVIDRSILAEYANAGLSYSGGALSATNAVNVYGQARAKLLNNDGGGMGDVVAVIDPFQAAYLDENTQGRTFNLADATFKNGFAGKFLGMTVFVSDNLTYTGDINIATNPTANDTVTLRGVTFTFVAAPAAAGDVDIGANAAESVDNLVLAINGGAVGTAYIALSSADRKKLRGVTATDNTTSIGLVAKGGNMDMSETFTDTTDNVGIETVHNLVMRRNAIDLVIQKSVGADIKDVSNRLGVNILAWTLYGYKTFVEGAQRMVDLQITSKAASASS